MSVALTLLVFLATPGDKARPIDAPAPTRAWTFSVALGAGASQFEWNAIEAGLELSLQPARHLRVHVGGTGAWVPPRGFGRSHEGIFSLLAGFDGVLPFESWELSLGAEAGPALASFDALDFWETLCGWACGEENWGAPRWRWLPSLRLRLGVGVLRFAPLVFGLEFGYRLLGWSRRDTQWADFRARAGLMF